MAVQPPRVAATDELGGVGRGVIHLPYPLRRRRCAQRRPEARCVRRAWRDHTGAGHRDPSDSLRAHQAFTSSVATSLPATEPEPVGGTDTEWRLPGAGLQSP